ncbi:potassium channel KOR1-like [Brassica napus]|uniref:potassium channel KOR1-like n=1 Tax=Brassica napus TaxID=3708 RepID=UPI00207911CD|nr:potassium channel KOR1-like [Brassica napus]
MEFAFIVDILRGWIYAYHDNQPIANDRFLHWCYRIWLLNPRKLELVAVAAVPLANIIQWEYLRWINIVRAMRGKELLEKLEKVESFNYAFIMFIKIMAIQLYCIHTTGCMFYQLATDFEGLPQIYQTWMSDIQIGNQNLSGLGNVQKYIASTYFATVTLSTVGYGDIHATNLTEMVALACLIIVSLTVWTYLGVQLANLFGRRSKKQIVGEKMDNLEKYLKEAKIAENLAEDIRGHMQMKYSDDYDRKILEDVPACLIAKPHNSSFTSPFLHVHSNHYTSRFTINKNFNESIIRSVSLFNGCSPEFFKHLASGAQQDFHPPGCTVLKEGNIVSQLHILYKGGLELLQGETVHPPLRRPTTVFGLESFVLNEPLPHTIRTYKGRDPAFVERLLQSVFGIQMQNDVIRKASLLNHAIFFDDLEKVKKLIHWGVSVDSVDYNNIKPLDFAINTGNTEIIKFLMSVVAETNTTGIDQEHAD